MAKYAFKLMHGTHRENKKRYQVGDVILTDNDLTKAHNSVVSTKFLKLSDEEKAKAEKAEVEAAAKAGFENAVEGGTDVKVGNVKYVPTNDELDKMTVQELKDHCESEEIQIGKANTKEALVKLILAQSAAK